MEHPGAGRRPYLALHRQASIGALHSVIAVPATRTLRGIPSEVPLDSGDGMPAQCALSLDNLALVPLAFFRERITRLSVDRMSQVCRALAVATGCD